MWMLAMTVMCTNIAMNSTNGTLTLGVTAYRRSAGAACSRRPLEDLHELQTVQVDDRVDLHVGLDRSRRGGHGAHAADRETGGEAPSLQAAGDEGVALGDGGLGVDQVEAQRPARTVASGDGHFARADDP